MKVPGSGPRVSVDNDRCELYGICAMEAPDLFDLGQDGRLRFRKRLLGAADMTQAIAAARMCPMQAVVLRGELDG
ncbi:ferredoxin [Amycolatopsis sp. FDAARGOS 1241]|uniref:ferredoxin n=1 Tax=Amycolatopsis sp. FDAARGOS 1241 TaxID=2778070 RepID=UPI001EF33C5C|nr:ferredoxin [Amycolatopsis sp. FDAARGOS 1241]